MLQSIREKTSGVIAFIILGLVIITMLFFGIESYMSAKVETYAARIEGPAKFLTFGEQVREVGTDEFRKRFEQARLLVDQRLVATAGRPQPSRRLDPRHQLGLRFDHRVAAHPRRRRHRRLAAPPQHLRRSPGDHAALHLVQVRQSHLEESRERLRRDLHTTTILRAH